MKRLTLYLKIALLLLVPPVGSDLKAQDYPLAIPNMQPVPAGTLVIAMDNINQSCSAPTGGTYLFNLKSYGLAIFMLDVNYKLQWAIRSGKLKDEIDFSTAAERIAPSYTSAATRDFRAGPLLILPGDTAGATYAIKIFNNGLPDSCKVKVYRLTAPVVADIRYTLTRPPKAALFNDSCDIHRNFMEMASVPIMNYDCVPNALTLRSGCYTIATDPHTVPGDLSPYDADSIYNFVMAGGNFLAECEGIKTFETLKKYQSVTGVVNDPPTGLSAQFNNNVLYENADMAYGQFQGVFRPWTRGAVKVWTYGSATANNFYPVVRCRRNSDLTYQYSATVSKMTSDTGSVVFYLGNHEFFTNDCHTCVAGTVNGEAEVNGIRMYLNAVLVPSKFQRCVNIFDIPLAVVMGEFTATRRVDGVAILRWSSLTEKDNMVFNIEHSTDGSNFTGIGEVAGRGDTERGFEYDFLHKEVSKGINYYRLRMVSTTGKSTFSETRKIIIGHKQMPLNIYPNPVMGRANLLLDANDGERIQVNVIDLTGRIVKEQVLVVKGQSATLALHDLSRGMYSVVVYRESGEQQRGKVMVAY